jgi:hypothetical protein
MDDPILRYQQQRVHADTLRRHFVAWRQTQDPPLPERCDNPECQFYTAPLVWNGQPFGLILDHSNGVNSDNRPENLRFLCPNCDAQLPTRGGSNRGRVEKAEGGFALVSGGVRHYQLPAEGGHYEINGGPVVVETQAWPDTGTNNSQRSDS